MKLNPFKRNKKRGNAEKILKKRKKNSRTTRRQDRGSLIKNVHGKPNLTLIGLIAFLSLAGLLMIYSASAIQAFGLHEDSFFFFKRQIIWIIVGSIFGYILYITPLSTLKKASPLILAFGIVILLIMLPEALFPGSVDIPFVLNKNGAVRWIGLGAFDFQVSELIKFGVVVYISAWLSRKVEKKKGISDTQFHFVYVFLPFVLLLGFICGLVLTQKDFDTTVIIGITALTVYYVSGRDRLHNIGVAVIAAIGTVFGSLALLLEDFRRERIANFWSIFKDGEPAPGEALAGSFQVWNGLVGFGSGWIFGRGYGESRIKQGFLQEAAYTDSIFVIIGEEFGFIGAIVVILAFLYFASIGFKIASNAKDRFSALLAVGMTTWIVSQALVNIAANVSLIPFGGLTLPFLSYGGSSTITVLMAVGVLLNVSKENNRK